MAAPERPCTVGDVGARDRNALHRRSARHEPLRYRYHFCSTDALLYAATLEALSECPLAGLRGPR
jgi:hypothetical protein